MVVQQAEVHIAPSPWDKSAKLIACNDCGPLGQVNDVTRGVQLGREHLLRAHGGGQITTDRGSVIIVSPHGDTAEAPADPAPAPAPDPPPPPVEAPAAVTPEIDLGSALDELGGWLQSVSDPHDADTGLIRMLNRAMKASGRPHLKSGEPPLVTTPADETVEAESPAGAPATHSTLAQFLTAAVASDWLGEPIDVQHDAPEAFPLGATAVTFSAVDGDGNAVQQSATVTVVDTTPPSLMVPPHLTIAVSDLDGILAEDERIQEFLNGADAADPVDPSPLLEHDAPDVLPLGITTVTFSAADASGNVTRAESSVDVQLHVRAADFFASLGPQAARLAAVIVGTPTPTSAGQHDEDENNADHLDLVLNFHNDDSGDATEIRLRLLEVGRSA